MTVRRQLSRFDGESDQETCRGFCILIGGDIKHGTPGGSDRDDGSYVDGEPASLAGVAPPLEEVEVRPPCLDEPGLH